MKICVFSDVHGNYQALDKMLSVEADVSRFFFLGDIFGYFTDQQQIIERMSKMDNLTCICGNHDAYYLRSLHDDSLREELVKKYGSSYLSKISDSQIEFLKNMSECLVEDIDGIKLAFYHGGPDDYLEQRIYPDTELALDSDGVLVANDDNMSDTSKAGALDVIFTGHTHYRLSRSLPVNNEESMVVKPDNLLQAGECMLINPGSLGQPRDGKGFSYCVFDTQAREVSFRNVEIDVDELLNSVYEAEQESDNYRYLVKKYKG